MLEEPVESVTPSLAVSTEVALLVRVTATRVPAAGHQTFELQLHWPTVLSWRVAVEAPAVGLVELAASVAG
jgi:hypothetical protein